MCLQAYECMICYQYMYPPIRQCTFGHSLCDNCHENTKVCPTCRNTYKQGNSRLMEIFCERLIFPCKYKDGGCYVSLPGNEMASHQEKCPVSYIHCPVVNFSFCTWIGCEKDAFKHCEEVHPTVNFFNGSEIEYNFTSDKNMTKKENVDFLVYAHKKIFHCNLKIDLTIQQKVKVSVFCLGDENEFKNYKHRASLFAYKRKPSNFKITTTSQSSTSDLGNRMSGLSVQDETSQAQDDVKYLTCKIFITKRDGSIA